MNLRRDLRRIVHQPPPEIPEEESDECPDCHNHNPNTGWNNRCNTCSCYNYPPQRDTVRWSFALYTRGDSNEVVLFVMPNNDDCFESGLEDGPRVVEDDIRGDEPGLREALVDFDDEYDIEWGNDMENMFSFENTYRVSVPGIRRFFESRGFEYDESLEQ